MDAQYHTPIIFGGGMETGNWMADFMNSYAWTIAGGAFQMCWPANSGKAAS